MHDRERSSLDGRIGQFGHDQSFWVMGVPYKSRSLPGVWRRALTSSLFFCNAGTILRKVSAFRLGTFSSFRLIHVNLLGKPAGSEPASSWALRRLC